MDDNEEVTYPPVDLSCVCCRRHPCECEALLARLKAYGQTDDEEENDENEETTY
jgi:hypothetical protein